MEKKKILIFLDELYFKKESKFCSKFNAGRFLYSLCNTFDLKFTFPVNNTTQNVITSVIDEKCAVPLPFWDSIISYTLKYQMLNKKIIDILKGEINNADIIWLRLPSLPGLLIARYALKLNKPVIMHLAGDIRLAYKSTKYNQLFKISAFLLGQFVHISQKKIIKENNAKVRTLCTGTVLKKEFSFNKSKFFIDSECMPLSKDSSAKQTFEKLLYVGRLIPSKGILFLISVILKIPTCTLAIVGYGELEKEIREYAKTCSKIEYLGFKSGLDLEKIYQNSDCLIMPTVNYPEGFPRVIVEAWNNGIAVIASNTGGIEGIGKHEDNLMLFRPGDVENLTTMINRLKEDKLLLSKIKKNGLITAKQLSKQVMLDLIKNTVNEVIENE
jgi:glycosyltransferase involved in cell wall biosynthesis